MPDPDADESGDSDSFQPPAESSNDDEDDDADNSGAEDIASKRSKPQRKKTKSSRTDILAARETQDGVGTPEMTGEKRKAGDNGFATRLNLTGADT